MVSLIFRFVFPFFISFCLLSLSFCVLFPFSFAVFCASLFAMNFRLSLFSISFSLSLARSHFLSFYLSCFRSVAYLSAIYCCVVLLYVSVSQFYSVLCTNVRFSWHFLPFRNFISLSLSISLFFFLFFSLQALIQISFSLFLSLSLFFLSLSSFKYLRFINNRASGASPRARVKGNTRCGRGFPRIKLRGSRRRATYDDLAERSRDRRIFEKNILLNILYKFNPAKKSPFCHDPKKRASAAKKAAPRALISPSINL